MKGFKNKVVMKKWFALFVSVAMVVTGSVAALGGGLKAETGNGSTGETNGPAGSETFSSILGDAVDFGIVTGDFDQSWGDAETNVAAKTAKCATQTGNDLTNKVQQTFIIGQVNDVFKIKGQGDGTKVWTTEEDKDKIQATGSEKVDIDTSLTRDQLNQTVQAMLDYTNRQSALLAGKQSNASIEEDGPYTQKYKVDLKGRGAGTYYVNLDKETYQKIAGEADKLHIYKDADQTLVFNVNAEGDLGIQKYSVNGKGSDSYLNVRNLSEDDQKVPCTIVWNFRNASSVALNGSVTGLILAPVGIVSTNATGSGWIVSQKVVINSGEWHNVYQEVKKPDIPSKPSEEETEEITPASVTLKAGKNIDGKPSTQDGFTFSLKEKSGSSWNDVSTAENKGSSVTFPEIVYNDKNFKADKEGGDVQTHIYKISEAQGERDFDGNKYKADSGNYYAKVVVKKTTIKDEEHHKKTTAFTAGKPEYFSDKDCTKKVDEDKVVFNNKTVEYTNQEEDASAVLKAEKTIDGKASSESGFQFALKEKSGDQWKDVSTSENKDWEIKFPALDYKNSNFTPDKEGGNTQTHIYQISETKGSTDENGNKYIADQSKYYAKVVVTKTVTKDDDKKVKLTALKASAPEYFKDERCTDPADKPVFNNMKAVAVRLSGTKVLKNGDLGGATGKFRFFLKDSNGRVIDTAKNNSQGKFYFGNLYFDQEGTYKYTVSEENKGLNVGGVKYDSEDRMVTIVVTKDKSKYSATVSGGDSLNFTNQQMTSVSVKKVWDDNNNAAGVRPDSVTVDLMADGKKEAAVVLSSENGWQGQFTNLPVNDSHGNIVYSVKEEKGNSSQQSLYKSSVTEDQSTAAGKSFTVTNTYKPGPVNIKAVKVLRNGNLKADEFTFDLYRADENGNPSGEPVATAKNGENGNIVFTEVPFNSEGYVLKERQGKDEQTSYDTSNKVIHIDASGKQLDYPEITNVYHPITLKVRKTSKDTSNGVEGLYNATYALHRIDKNGADVVAGIQNSDKNGYMYFGNIQPGYIYYFKEVAAPGGHTVDPLDSKYFKVEWNGNIDPEHPEKSVAIIPCDKNGKPTGEDAKAYDVSKDEGTVLVRDDRSTIDTDDYQYSWDGGDLVAVANTSVQGALPEDAEMKVTPLDKGSKEYADAEKAISKNGTETGEPVLFDVSFYNKDGKKIEPEAGTVDVTIQYKEGTSGSKLEADSVKLVHINGNKADFISGTVSSQNGRLVETSFTSSTFSTFGIVGVKNMNAAETDGYNVTAQGVADRTTDLKVNKMAADGSPLEGAQFAIYDVKTGDVIGTWTTGKDGNEEIHKTLNVNTQYRLRETAAPEGYSKIDDVIFTIDDYGNIKVESEATSGGKVTTGKTQTGDADVAELNIYDAKLTATKWVVNKKTITKSRELTKTEPDKVITVSSAVQTGDEFNAVPLVILMAAAAAGLAAVMVLRKRTSEK